MREVAASRVRPSTLHRYEEEISLHIVPALGRLRLDKLRPQHLSEFYRDRLRYLSPGSVRRLHAVLRRALNVAVRWQLLVQNPALVVDPPSLPPTSVQPWSLEEAQRFLDTLTGTRTEARWILGLDLGMRQGEVLGLAWGDVDLAARTLTVRNALQRQPDGALALVPPKTARSRRVIPLPQSVVTSLQLHQERQRRERAKGDEKWHRSDLVFSTSTGSPVHPRNDYRAFVALMKRAGVRRIRVHDLRHTAASLLLAQGVPARVVMEILGHSQIDITLNTYSHVTPPVAREAADRMGAALWSS